VCAAGLACVSGVCTDDLSKLETGASVTYDWNPPDTYDWNPLDVMDTSTFTGFFVFDSASDGDATDETARSSSP